MTHDEAVRYARGVLKAKYGLLKVIAADRNCSSQAVTIGIRKLLPWVREEVGLERKVVTFYEVKNG